MTPNVLTNFGITGSNEVEEDLELNLNLDQSQARNVLEFFYPTITPPEELNDGLVNFAETVLDSGFERTHQLGIVGRIASISGGGSVPIITVRQIVQSGILALGADAVQGINTLDFIINGPSLENPVVANTARAVVAAVNRSTYDVLRNGI